MNIYDAQRGKHKLETNSKTQLVVREQTVSNNHVRVF